MTLDYQARLKKMRHLSSIELETLRDRIFNHIDEKGNNILELFPFFIKLPTPLMDHFKNNDFIYWLEENIDAENYIRPWPNMLYFKNAEDAMAFKLRWI